MANMTSMTFTPLGRWWHPLPLMSGVGALIGTIAMKLMGFIDFSWWFVILFPIGADIAVNGLIVLIEWMAWKISDARERRRRK